MKQDNIICKHEQRGNPVVPEPDVSDLQTFALEKMEKSGKFQTTCGDATAKK